jgi:uncharacterized protein YxeA
MKKTIIALIKLIILAAIFYALLAFNVFHIGEKLIPNTKDYVGTETTQDNQDLEQIYLE